MQAVSGIVTFLIAKTLFYSRIARKRILLASIIRAPTSAAIYGKIFAMADLIFLHEWLDERMKAAGLSATELGRATDLHPAIISKILAQKTLTPRYETCAKIARYFMVPPELLVNMANRVPVDPGLAEWETLKYNLAQVSEMGRKEILANIQVKIAIEQKRNVIIS